MWQPNTLKIKNLMTHRDTEFSFKNNECIMLFGINSTDSGSDSNGGGKSTILEGLTLALTGETNRGTSKDEFISDNEDDCYIELNLTNNIGNVNELTIKRWFFRKKSSKIELWENGEKNKKMTSVPESSKRVLELIGLSKEDILHFFVIGQETNYSFLTANDTDKKDIISRFSDIEFISEKIEKLKNKNKEYDSSLKVLSSKSIRIEAKIELTEERISDIKENFESELKESKSDIKSNINKLKTKISSIEIDTLEISEETDKLELELSNIKIPNYNDLELESSNLRNNLKILNKDLNKIEIENNHLESVKDGFITCPECSNEFSLNSELSNIQIIGKISTNSKKIKSIKSEIKTVKSKISKVDESLDKITAIRDSKDNLDRKIRRLNSRMESNLEDIENYENKISKLKKELKKINKKNVDDELNPLLEVISESKEELKSINSEKKNIDNDILENDFWIHHFSKKGFLTFLTNKSIKSIEGVTNSYLKQMNSHLQVLIDGYTELKSGDIREKINISIVRKGMEISSFNRYSGGEKGRIKLANILGLQHLINLTSPTGGLNFLGLDEVFEGLDKTGQIDVLNILNNLKVTSLVITHRNQPIGAQNEVFIEKVNGHSRIINKSNVNKDEKIIKREAKKIRQKE